jgi:hypothetical protein
MFPYSMYLQLPVMPTQTVWSGQGLQGSPNLMDSSKEDIKALATSDQKLEACLSANFKTVERRLDFIEKKLTTSATSLASVSRF